MKDLTDYTVVSPNTWRYMCLSIYMPDQHVIEFTIETKTLWVKS